MRFTLLPLAALLCGSPVLADEPPIGSSQDVERITAEAQRTPESPLFRVDRPLYEAVQEWKNGLNSKHGFAFAIEDTAIYQYATGVDDAMVNTLGLFATWKIFRSEDGKNFGGIGFQGETRGDPLGSFVGLRDELGTLWSPNDSTSDDYSRINQLWWGQRFADGKVGVQAGKIDAGSLINANRFAGSGNTQFFGQPYATNPARSFPQNGLGVQARIEPTEWLYLLGIVSDSDAINDYSPFATVGERFFFAGEVGFRPKVPGLGDGTYRFMLYSRETESADEVGWALSFDQNLGEEFGAFFRYGGNDGGLNTIEHIVSLGVSALKPFGRPSDQAGVGVSFTHPTDEKLRDEQAAEVFYRMQLTEGVSLSASVQLILDPSASDQDAVGVFGLRVHVLY